MELSLLKLTHSHYSLGHPSACAWDCSLWPERPRRGRWPRVQAHPGAAGMGSRAPGVGATAVLSCPPGLKSGRLATRDPIRCGQVAGPQHPHRLPSLIPCSLYPKGPCNPTAPSPRQPESSGAQA
ncbi:hypothetical protein HJG60_007721 [Phyllostomus discolor]|uniref:Uncharacterized protein n=1 Tax=Phyllostomus discolor TaxID=89673 RepID=A0A834BDL1_9CHIR|nr:hypothetical protein HJG60_007721 [Phyllostomus discolor]